MKRSYQYSHRRDSRMISGGGELLMLSFSQVKSAAVPVTTTQRKTITTSSAAWRSAGREKRGSSGLEGKVDKQVFTELLQENSLTAAT